MKNKYFPDEDITQNDLFFLCSMIERVARKLHRRNEYVVNTIGTSQLTHLLSVASVLHCENPEQVAQDWIDGYHLTPGQFDITDVNPELCKKIPSATAIGKVYARLILDTLQPNEDFASAAIRVYNNPICRVIDDYNASAYFEPSYVVAKAYFDGGF